LFGVVEKSAIAVDGGIGSFLEHGRPAVPLQSRNKVGPWGELHAMGRPEYLAPAAEFNDIAKTAIRMIGGMAAGPAGANPVWPR
jgi:hypothetical protein